MLKHDSRVVKVVVHDTYNAIDFLEIHIPQREKGNLFVNTEPIYWQAKPIGYVEITYNDSAVARHIKEQKSFFLRIFGATFLVLFSVLIPLLYFQILRPLKKLTQQAMKLQNGKLDEPFAWTDRDEVGVLGQSFELARVQIQQHVEALKKASETDKLTKVFNRHKTDIVLEEEKRRTERYGHSFGILLADVDNFKGINDTFGHQRGDAVLEKIATLLKTNSRLNDTVGRWGGEEFIIICPEIDKQGLEEFAYKLVRLVASASFEEVSSQTISVGATLCYKGEELSRAVSRADGALYEAKSGGKNRAIIA